MFFGLLTVDAWNYRCVLSNAKIELMCIDLPHVKYKKEKKTGVVTEAEYKVSEDKNKEILESLRKNLSKESDSPAPNSDIEKISLTSLFKG